MDKIGIVYKITNKLNNKVYIGQTKNCIKRRFTSHCNKGTVLYNSINKYGRSNFIMEELYICFSQKELDISEKYFISLFNCLVPSGYNLESGGNGKKEVHELTRKKLKEINTGKKHTDITKLKMSTSHKGKIRTEEHSKKLSLALKGRIPSKQCIDAARLSNLGKIPKNARKIKCLDNNIIYNSIHEAGRKLKCSPSKICLVAQGKRKQTNGYSFIYVENK